MSTTGKASAAVQGGVGLIFFGAPFVGNLRWMDGEFRIGDPATRADQWSVGRAVRRLPRVPRGRGGGRDGPSDARLRLRFPTDERGQPPAGVPA